MTHQLQLPTLPYDSWIPTRVTLHLILQIIGKVRLKMTPRKNHWWYITEYLSTNGFTTSPISLENGLDTVEIIVDVKAHAVRILSSFAEEKRILLEDGLTIATFYQQFMKALKDLGIEPNIIAKPYDMGIDEPFSQITAYHHFDWEHLERFWKVMLWVDGVFKEFSGRFYGKTCPVHVYWHHMDLTVTRFSGRKGPALDPKMRLSDKDAYSHEVISFGFWAGDDQVRQPAFYAYAYPSPEGINQRALFPTYAQWIDSNGSPMAFMTYDDLILSKDPRADLLQFLESAYQAGASLANWDIEGLTTPDLKHM